MHSFAQAALSAGIGTVCAEPSVSGHDGSSSVEESARHIRPCRGFGVGVNEGSGMWPACWVRSLRGSPPPS